MIERLKNMLPSLIKLVRSLGRLEGKLDVTLNATLLAEKTLSSVTSDLKAMQKRLMRMEAQLGPQQAMREKQTNISTSRARKLDIEDVYKELEEAAPEAFAHWIKLVEVNAQTFEGYPVHSCAVKGHPVGHYFYYYCKPQLVGRVLDIGCGPQPVPFYLKDYPVELISGIDPLPAVEGHPFEFAQGLAEILPWEDNTFSTVILATSLDHILLLDRAYDEILRVLKPDGKVLMWTACVNEAKKYDPYDPDVLPVDDYHLFHFTKQGFEDSINEHFFIEDVTRFENEIDHYFYSLSPFNDT